MLIDGIKTYKGDGLYKKMLINPV